MNKDILAVQNKCSDILGFNHLDIEQGSVDWQRLRMGVVTASKAHILLMEDAKAPFPSNLEIIEVKRGVNIVYLGDDCYQGTKADCKEWVRNQLPRVKSETKQTYMNELVAQIATGKLVEEVSAKPLAWGKENECDARDAYGADTFETIKEVSFLYQDESMRAGISPDGLIDGEDKGLELKCPWSSSVWVAFATQGYIKKEEIAQCQFSMMVTGFDSWAFAKFDPRNENCKKLHRVIIERDEVMIQKMREGLKSFIADMDESLKKLGLEFGMQWK